MFFDRFPDLIQSAFANLVISVRLSNFALRDFSVEPRGLGISFCFRFASGNDSIINRHAKEEREFIFGTASSSENLDRLYAYVYGNPIDRLRSTAAIILKVAMKELKLSNPTSHLMDCCLYLFPYRYDNKGLKSTDGTGHQTFVIVSPYCKIHHI